MTVPTKFRLTTISVLSLRHWDEQLITVSSGEGSAREASYGGGGSASFGDQHLDWSRELKLVLSTAVLPPSIKLLTATTAI